MSGKNSWKRTKGTGGIQYDYSGALALSAGDAAAAAADMAQQIRGRTSQLGSADDWVAMVLRLPDALRHVLLDQLDQGNLLTGIGQSGWPAPNSIVANFRDRFGVEGQKLPPEVALQVVNDPHQWRENISQIVDGQEHMLMA
ncbi:hypothetical protein SAMN05216359_101349 [Roseateles sp. YR242]|uniref:hypothetical protein n=1 Tax=Roseateles sp. YR242 TaxID=1855305 RepID=UPI0008BBFF95|nr:hypothetical protein [Roseateles sp. YR242]SEK30154.1 hypothetical protein SAMN05216359_101349 [Roseateles sp. YR242]